MVESVYAAAARHRKELGRQQDAAAKRMAEAYARSFTSIRSELNSVQLAIRDARQRGEVVDVQWLAREARVQSLLLQVQRQLLQVAPLVTSTTSALVQDALTAATANTEQIFALGDVAFGRINPVAVGQIVGALDRGALADLIAAKVPSAVEASKQVLVDAVIKGWNPARTARELRRVASDLPALDARRLARTEQMRAYREATRLSYIDNPAVSTWIWSCRKSIRSCPSCWAQDGTRHQVRVQMATHPNCMCTMLPAVAGVDYGDTGVEAFAKLSPDDQRKILGSPGKYNAYKSGRISLPDLVQKSRSDKWGPSSRVASLKNALAKASNR